MNLQHLKKKQSRENHFIMIFTYKPVVFVCVVIYTERKLLYHSSKEWNVKDPE